MNVASYSWEKNLVDIASDALASGVGDELRQTVHPDSIDRAYQHCARLTQFHSKTFYAASTLLHSEKRKAVRALYAFCRISDDLVDCSQEEIEMDAREWLQGSDDGHISWVNEILLAWDDTRLKYNIPAKYVDQLIEGLQRDHEQVEYQTFAELTEYCYGVACTVGLMSMQIIGYKNTDAIPFAIRLGVALQMTNILRDISADYRIGRVYLPQEELAAFGLSNADLEKGIVTDRWRDFMRFQIDRVRKLYANALPGIAYLNPDGRFAIQAAAEIYQEILKEIETSDYNVFNQRASVSQMKKLRMLPGIWWRAKSSQSAK
jgi:phytoene synthase